MLYNLMTLLLRYCFPLRALSTFTSTRSIFTYPVFNVDFYPRVFLSTSAPVRPFITFHIAVSFAPLAPVLYGFIGSALPLQNIPFEHFCVTRCPVCAWRLPDRSPLRCSHIYMLPYTFSVSRYLTLFYNVLPRYAPFVCW